MNVTNVRKKCSIRAAGRKVGFCNFIKKKKKKRRDKDSNKGGGQNT